MMPENTTAHTGKLLMIDRASSNNLNHILNNIPKTRTSTAHASSMEQIMSIIGESRKSTKGGTMAERSKNSTRELKKLSMNFSSSRDRIGALLGLILKICIGIITKLIKNGQQTKKECEERKKYIGKV